MGYYVSQRGCNFFIAAENKEKALQAIKDLGDKPMFSWVDNKSYLEADTLAKAMNAWRWSIDEEDDNVVNICFDGEKLGDDEVLFQTIAPFVKADSYIEMDGEEGCLWRWVFDGKRCQEVTPQIIW